MHIHEMPKKKKSTVAGRALRGLSRAVRDTPCFYGLTAPALNNNTASNTRMPKDTLDSKAPKTDLKAVLTCEQQAKRLLALAY